MTVPPKSIKNKVVSRYNGGRTGEYERALDQSSMDEQAQLDIIKQQRAQAVEVFREYIQRERRIVRNRIGMLSLFYTGIIMIVIAAALYVTSTFLDQVRQDFMIVQEDVKTACRETALDGKRLDGLAARTEQISSAALKTDEKAEEARSKTENLDKELGEMDEVVKMLRMENDELESGLGDLKGTLPRISQTLDALRKEIMKLKSASVTASAQTALERAKPPESKPLALAISPRGSKASIPWLFSIPE